MSGGWIGVDLDGTLAHYDGWKGVEHVGPPVPAMLARVRRWLERGITVKIFTARVSVPDGRDREDVVSAIHRWCAEHGLPALQVTCTKDFGLVELWDDRAVQVIVNTGQRADGGS
jgi:hypothetical protein